MAFGLLCSYEVSLLISFQSETHELSYLCISIPILMPQIPGGRRGVVLSYICPIGIVAPQGMGFEPFWSEIEHRFQIEFTILKGTEKMTYFGLK